VIGNNAGKEGYFNTLDVFDFYENSTFEAFNVSTVKQHENHMHGRVRSTHIDL